MNSEQILIAESKINKILRDLAEDTGAARMQLSDHTDAELTNFDVRIELTMPTKKPKLKVVSRFSGRRGLR